MDELRSGKSPNTDDGELRQKMSELQKSLTAKGSKVTELEKAVASKVQVYMCVFNVCVCAKIYNKWKE